MFLQSLKFNWEGFEKSLVFVWPPQAPEPPEFLSDWPKSCWASDIMETYFESELTRWRTGGKWPHGGAKFQFFLQLFIFTDQSENGWIMNKVISRMFLSEIQALLKVSVTVRSSRWQDSPETVFDDASLGNRRRRSNRRRRRGGGPALCLSFSLKLQHKLCLKHRNLIFPLGHKRDRSATLGKFTGRSRSVEPVDTVDLS